VAQTSNSAVPVWAIEEATAALAMDVSVSEIEKRLIAKGLTPMVAETVVMDLLKAQIARHVHPSEAIERNQFGHRALSSVVMYACIVLGFLYGEGYSAAEGFLGGALPLACIWFPIPMAARWGDNYPMLLRWAGWVALVAVLIYRVVLLTL
jgi:hypothetical protein